MLTNFVLIDFENVQVKSLALLKGDAYSVKVFLGPKNSKLPVELVLAMHELGKRADYILLGVSGANALDFHITYYLGKLAAENPEGRFHIISKDTGFDSLVKHVQSKGIHCQRSASIEQMPGVAETLASIPESPRKPSPKAAAPRRKAAPPVSKSKPVAQPAGAVQTVLDNLLARGSAQPKTIKTLSSSIKSLRLNLSDDQIAALITELQTMGKISINGLKLSYSL